jgi:ankyrin repeat protein
MESTTIYYKFLDQAFTEGYVRSPFNNVVWTHGLNTIVLPSNYRFNPFQLCGSVTRIEHLMNFVSPNYSYVVEISVPESIDLIPNQTENPTQWFASQYIIQTFHSLSDPKTIEILFNRGANLTKRLIVWAIQKTNYSVMKFMLDHGYDDAQHTIQACVCAGSTQSLRWLIDNGIKIHPESESSNLIGQAAFRGHYDMVCFLIDLGFDLHLDAEYALRHAARNGHLEIVHKLIENGANVHTYAECAVRWASRYGSTESHLFIVKKLVTTGSDLHIWSEWPLRYAAKSGHTAIVEYLLDKEADPRVMDSNALTRAAKNRHTDIIRLLIAAGANPRCGIDSPLRWSARNGDLSLVKYFVDLGADIHADSDGAIRWATLNGHIFVTKFLLEHGANPDTHDHEILMNLATRTYSKDHNSQQNLELNRISLLELIIKCTTYDFLTDTYDISPSIKYKKRYQPELIPIIKLISQRKMKQNKIKQRIESIQRRESND